MICNVTRVFMADFVRVIVVIGVCLAISCNIKAFAKDKDSSGPPNVEDLQAGDLIWPKKPGEVIPYSATSGRPHESDAQRWGEERDLFIVELMQRPSLSSADRERLRVLRDMYYDHFLEVFSENVTPGEIVPYGGVVGVGHVAIVRMKDGTTPTVVEALWGKGIEETPYKAWTAQRAGQWFWHGRLEDVESGKKGDCS